MRRPPQDALGLPDLVKPDYATADFVEAESNAEALGWLRRAADWPAGRLVLWGEAGCGKTHLLHIWARQSGAALLAAHGLRGLPDLPPAPGIAIDEADAPAEEAALLHLLNIAQERRMPVLLAARTPPARWAIGLPDLASRLRAAAAVRILSPEDALLRAILARLFVARQLSVSEQVQDWLLLRLPRTPAALREAALQLDRASLAGKTPITRTLAAQVLSALSTTAPPPA